MLRIKQEDSTGSGLACIAMIARTYYQDVRSRAIEILGLPEFGPFHVESTDLVNLAAMYKVEVAQKKRRFEGWTKLPLLALVAISFRSTTNTWHWVVYTRGENDFGYVMDPRPSVKSDQRIDFGRMRVEWFLTVA